MKLTDATKAYFQTTHFIDVVTYQTAEPGSRKYEHEMAVVTKQQGTHNDVAEYLNGFPARVNTQCVTEH